MTDVLSSLAVPCARCGALVPTPGGSAAVACHHCGTQSQLAAHQIERLTQHLMLVHAAEANARTDQDGAAMGRAWRKRGALYLAVLLGPGAIASLGCSAFVSFTGERYVFEFMGTRRDAVEFIITAVLIVSTAAFFVWMMVDLEVAKRRAAGTAPQVIGVSRCVSCGASVPMILGRQAACPFCGAGLASAHDAAHRLEGAAGAQVGQAYAEHANGVRQIGAPVMRGQPERAAMPIRRAPAPDAASWHPQSGAVSPWQALAPALHPWEVTHLEALARAIGFRPEDLQAHRTGNWSTRDRLKRGGIGCAVASILGIPVIVIIALTTPSVERFAEYTALMLIVPLLAFMVVAIPALFGTVRAVGGIVSLTSRYESEENSAGGSSIFIQHYIDVGGKSFKVTPPTALTILGGRAYRVYVSSWGKTWGKTLMSMEPYPEAPVPAAPGYPDQRPWSAV